jgi:hypothetical protein
LNELLTATALEPGVQNGLPTDASYFEGGEVIVPDGKTDECLQSWDVLKRLQQQCSEGTLAQRFGELTSNIENAAALYQALKSKGVTFETKSSDWHLDAVLDAVGQFQHILRS